MNFIKTEIDGVYIIEPKVFYDNRGYFFESYNQKAFEEAGLHYNFIQDNQSKSEPFAACICKKVMLLRQNWFGC